MTIPDIERIRKAFHTEPFPTRGNQKGMVVKFEHPFFYLKIYDCKEGAYSVQMWRYGKQLPESVTTVQSKDLIKYIKDLR